MHLYIIVPSTYNVRPKLAWKVVYKVAVHTLLDSIDIGTKFQD